MGLKPQNTIHLKAVVPKHIRLAYKLFHRAVQDRKQGWVRQFASVHEVQADWAFTLSLQQPILPGVFFENKTGNMRLAAARINRIVVAGAGVCDPKRAVGRSLTCE